VPQRHRFITDRWGWELPCGWVNPAEDPAEARREVLEETGWEPGPVKLPCSYGADVGISDARFHLCQADGAARQGPPTDSTEATRVAWIPLSEVREYFSFMPSGLRVARSAPDAGAEYLTPEGALRLSGWPEVLHVTVGEERI
jgi:8-oxo-dGTP pyrophosphatase MutT (NUDIX family)